jgi:hypothetical protein
MELIESVMLVCAGFVPTLLALTLIGRLVGASAKEKRESLKGKLLEKEVVL